MLTGGESLRLAGEQKKRLRACTEAKYITERAGKAFGKPSGAAELAWGGTCSLVAAATSPAPARRFQLPLEELDAC